MAVHRHHAVKPGAALAQVVVAPIALGLNVIATVKSAFNFKDALDRKEKVEESIVKS